MIIVALLCAAGGYALGSHFRVMVLAPITLVAVLLVASIAAWHGSGAGAAIGAAIISALGIQLGYVCGAAIAYSMSQRKAATLSVRRPV